MDAKSLDLLEYGKILTMLAKETVTEIGRKNAQNLSPAGWEEAEKRQRLGREVAQVLNKVPSPALSEVKDVRARVTATNQGFVLSGKDLRDVLDVLVAFDVTLSWMKQVDESFIEITRIKARIPDLSGLRQKLDDTVDEEGFIKDSASPRLYSLRRSIREFQDKMRRRAEELARGRFSAFVQDSIVTIRNGRYVIPVKQEHASKVQGIVHDQSGSGQTLFIEPQELVEIGNNLRKLELLERDEVERILAEMSSLISRNSLAINEGLMALGDLDLSLAKVRLMNKWKGAFPRLSPHHEIILVKAWHPLLKDNPVPMDVELSERGTRTLIITGPNMGGKTVALKTVGLLTCMALAGLPCPCHENTVIGDIEDVLADIGDEQSIEENLSTFSAHIRNVKRIIERSGPGRLVLIDELCQGTDPEEGSALAIAVLEEIHRKNALTVVTSHFSELKILASNVEGMENASVEWDAVNMVPTYRLLVGKPGRSNAFLVARKLGIPENILQRARDNMQQELVHLDDVIQEMEEATQQARLELQRTAEERDGLRLARERYERELLELKEREKEIIYKARKEAEGIVSRARLEFEKALKEIRTREKSEREKIIPEIRQRLEKLSEEVQVEQDHEKAGPPISREEAVPGLTVRVVGFSQPGVIVEPPTGDGKVTVQVGQMRVRTDIGHLRASTVGNEMDESKRPSVNLSLEKRKTVSPQIDLRGLTREEACAALDKYLDDAFLAGLSEVKIIHGKGTGALRDAVEEYLKSQSAKVSAFRSGGADQGGTGVTIAQLK